MKDRNRETKERNLEKTGEGKKKTLFFCQAEKNVLIMINVLEDIT